MCAAIQVYESLYFLTLQVLQLINPRLNLLRCVSSLFEFISDLYHKTTDDNLRRDYLFYLSVGNTRLKVTLFVRVVWNAVAQWVELI